MAYSRCGPTNALYRGMKIFFVSHLSDLFMKYSIPLALLAAVRTVVEGCYDSFKDFAYGFSIVNPVLCGSPFNDVRYSVYSQVMSFISDLRRHIVGLGLRFGAGAMVHSTRSD